MHAQLTASLRHLKHAITHLHDAKLIIETIDKAAANYIERLLRPTRDLVKTLEDFNDGKGDSPQLPDSGGGSQ